MTKVINLIKSATLLEKLGMMLVAGLAIDLIADAAILLLGLK